MTKPGGSLPPHRLMTGTCFAALCGVEECDDKRIVLLVGRLSSARDCHYRPHSPSSLASAPFTARAQPFNFRSRVAALIAGLKRCSSRQLSANFSGSG